LHNFSAIFDDQNLHDSLPVPSASSLLTDQELRSEQVLTAIIALQTQLEHGSIVLEEAFSSGLVMAW
jgi:hypothetical protein